MRSENYLPARDSSLVRQTVSEPKRTHDPAWKLAAYATAPTVGEKKAPVSVLIPTKDEAINIVGCIQSVAWADDIVVLDSFSTDDTAQLAREAGVRVVQRRFDDYSTHKNWALDQVEFNHPWVLTVDADERVTPELAQEVIRVVEGRTEHVGYYIARRNYFQGVWLRHGGRWPDYNLRLLRRGHGRYEERSVHEHIRLDGTAGFLDTPLVHLNGNKGMYRYLERHIDYAYREALEAHKTTSAASVNTLAGKLRERGPEHRRALKNFAYRYVPTRPVFVFLWMYGVKLGFLDGRAGLLHCLLRMMYEFQIDLLLDEIRRGRPSCLPGTPES